VRRTIVAEFHRYVAGLRHTTLPGPKLDSGRGRPACGLAVADAGGNSASGSLLRRRQFSISDPPPMKWSDSKCGGGWMSVSYLLSSYNKDEYLRTVLESIAFELNDTGGEVVIIDDGSTDGSWGSIQAFAKTDQRIRIFRQPNAGIFCVTNRLLAEAGASWLRMIDCDDPLVPGSTKYLKHTADLHSLDYVFGSTRPYGPAPLRTEALLQCPPFIGGEVKILNDPIRHAIRDYNHVPTTTLIRANIVPNNLQLPEQFLSCQDLALALRLFQHARVGMVDRAVCFQLVDHERRLSANEALTWFQTIEIIREFGEKHLTEDLKHIAARKVVSRSLRRLRKRRQRCEMFDIYVRLLWLYGSLRFRQVQNWVPYLDAAAIPYKRELESVLSTRKIY
jgi:glycosyltransferase involved in cell wall biosynthesis